MPPLIARMSYTTSAVGLWSLSSRASAFFMMSSDSFNSSVDPRLGLARFERLCPRLQLLLHGSKIVDERGELGHVIPHAERMGELRLEIRLAGVATQDPAESAAVQSVFCRRR